MSNCMNLLAIYDHNRLVTEIDVSQVDTEIKWFFGRIYSITISTGCTVDCICDLLIKDSFQPVLIASQNGLRQYIYLDLVGRTGNRLIFNEISPFDLDSNTMYDDVLPKIEHIWINDPYTSITWSDGTVTKCKVGMNDVFDKKTGIYICIAKKYLALTGKNFNNAINELADSAINMQKIKENKIRRKEAAKNAELNN